MKMNFAGNRNLHATAKVNKRFRMSLSSKEKLRAKVKKTYDDVIGKFDFLQSSGEAGQIIVEAIGGELNHSLIEAKGKTPAQAYRKFLAKSLMSIMQMNDILKIKGKLPITEDELHALFFYSLQMAK